MTGSQQPAKLMPDYMLPVKMVQMQSVAAVCVCVGDRCVAVQKG